MIKEYISGKLFNLDDNIEVIGWNRHINNSFLKALMSIFLSGRVENINEYKIKHIVLDFAKDLVEDFEKGFTFIECEEDLVISNENYRKDVEFTNMICALGPKYACCLYNGDNSCICVCKELNSWLFNCISLLILHWIRMWVEKDKCELDNDEKDLMTALSSCMTAYDVRSAFCDFNRKWNLRPENLRILAEQAVNRMLSVSIERKKQDCKQKILEHTHDLSNLLERYSATLKEKQALNIMLAGLENVRVENNSDFINYLMNNKSVKVNEIKENSIVLDICTCLTNYDEDFYEGSKHSPYSTWVKGATSARFPIDDALLVCDHIIGYNADAKLKMWSRVEFSSYSIDRYGAPYNHQEDYVPNIHIMSYNCFGENGPIIYQYLNEGNYIDAIEQTIASVGSTNISENATNVNFFTNIFSETCGKCIEYKNESYTVTEFVNKLKEENKETSNDDCN